MIIFRLGSSKDQPFHLNRIDPTYSGNNRSVLKKLILSFSCWCGMLLNIYGSGAVVSGYVKDAESGEALMFTTVYVTGSSVGTTTNQYGFYSLSVDSALIKNDSIHLSISYVGYQTVQRSVPAGRHVELNFDLKQATNELKELVVVASQSKLEEELKSTEMSMVRLPVKQIKSLPAIGGETDIVKVVQLLPGVAKGSEGGTGMFVRGGDADQNLVLLDESIVYNIGHLFGFFSVFNPDALKDLTMIKGAFPSNYGGRLSSILDIRMKEGHQNKFQGTGGIGLLSSRLTLEGPISKKASFLVSGRRTYIDQVFKLVELFVPYYFYDINAKVNYIVSQNDRIYYSMYYGNDVLKFDEGDVVEEEASDTSSGNDLGLDFGFTLGNLTNTIRWNHIYNAKMFSNISLISTNFNYNIRGQIFNNQLLIRSNIFDLGIKADYDYYYKADNHIKFGGMFTHHTFKPNIISTQGDITEFLESSEGEKLFTQEMAVYGQSDKEFTDKIKVNTGLRISGSVVEGKVYTGLEPRLASRYLIDKYNSVKLSYSRMKQYMHRVSSSTVALPTDLWYPVTRTIKPQSSSQIAAGYNHIFPKWQISCSLEAYYKWMNNLIEYREGANLILNNRFENELLQGSGDAYGLEFFVKKEEGNFTGWISYTLAWATRDFDDLNNGERFWAKYDRRHTVSTVATLKLSKRWTFSAVWVYSTGSRFTAQIGQYVMPNATYTGFDIIPIYTARNAVQMSPSHRLDLNISLRPKKDRKFTGEWNFGCYNFYNRATPYRIDIVPIENGLGYRYQQPGLFGFIPSIAYNFKF